jgi:hypothetical protein
MSRFSGMKATHALNTFVVRFVGHSWRGVDLDLGCCCVPPGGNAHARYQCAGHGRDAAEDTHWPPSARTWIPRRPPVARASAATALLEHCHTGHAQVPETAVRAQRRKVPVCALADKARARQRPDLAELARLLQGSAAPVHTAVEIAAGVSWQGRAGGAACQTKRPVLHHAWPRTADTQATKLSGHQNDAALGTVSARHTGAQAASAQARADSASGASRAIGHARCTCWCSCCTSKSS